MASNKPTATKNSIKDVSKNVMISNTGQYIRKINFEHMISRLDVTKLGKVSENKTFKLAPHVEKISDEEYELVLLVQISSSIKDSEQELFQLIFEYIGVFQISGEITESEKEKILLIQGALLIFPFVRSEIANITMKSGLQPIMMDPVDFANIYEAYNAQVDKKINQ